MPETSPAEPLLPITVRSKFFHEGEKKWFLKGVTYGPFKPNADGDLTATPEHAREDFSLMRDMGVNLIRVYHVPPGWLLDLAAEHGLRVLISIPWTQHVEFLNSSALKRQIIEVIRTAVSKNKGHPAIFGYFVGNEVPTTMVRWLGAQRVVEFLEKLIEVARETDPRPLYSYASYPPTEYLLPANVDFYSFNVYLERRPDFERYLARLQNLAEDKPMILGEFGLDTMRNGEDRQAEILDWHLEVVVKGGAAGTIFFAWTGRVVHWWTRDRGLGIRTREAGSPAEKSLSFSQGKTGGARCHHHKDSAHQVSQGQRHCLLLQRGQDAWRLPQGTRSSSLPRFRNRSCR
jgi:hypothetical protein